LVELKFLANIFYKSTIG